MGFSRMSKPPVLWGLPGSCCDSCEKASESQVDAQPLHHYQQEEPLHYPKRGGEYEELVKTLMVHIQTVFATEVIVAEVQLDPALTAPWCWM